MDYTKTEALIVKLTEVDTLLTFQAVFRKYSLELISLISFIAFTGFSFSFYLLYTREKLKNAILTIEHILEHESNLLNSLGEGVYGIDLQGKCTFINQTGCDILGYSVDEILGEDNHLLFHHHHHNGEFYEKRDCPVHQTTKDLIPRTVKDWFVKKDGTFVPVKLVITPINENGSYTGAVVAFTDITEKLKIKNELINKEEQLRLAFETTGDGLWDWDLQSNQVFHNGRFQEIMGISGDNVIHTHDILTAFVHPDDKNHVNDLLHSCHSGNCDYSSIHRIVKIDNSIAWIHDRAKVVKRDKDLNPLRIVGSITDITEQKLAQLQLSQLNQSLEQQISEAVKENQKKDYALMQQSRFSSIGELISNIAHQWRQPLNTISIKIMLLSDYYRTNELEKDIFNSLSSAITQEINTLSTTIDNFRTFFASTNEPEMINIPETINESLNLLSDQIVNSHVTLKIDSPEEYQLYCVKNEFQHLVIHLLKNSLEIFNERDIASPLVAICVQMDESSLIFTYEDNGKGVAPENIDMIFDPYYTTKFQSREKGLGLYVIKLIIDHHLNGRIIAANTDQGLKFTVTIPLTSNAKN
jgi:PAS domain S-box-containing protein